MTLPFPATAVTSTAQALLFGSGSALHLLPTASPVASSSSSLDAKQNAAGLIRAVALNDDCTLAASAGDDKTLHLYDVVDGRLELRNTRNTAKRVASLSFASGGIVVTDKVGDVYLYPLEPRDVTSRPQGFVLAADPSLNPDADFLLGHVSVISQSILSPCGKYLITADRDEHIRVSRFPKAYVVERYLWGSEGFVSAIHIPPSQPNLLVSGGGEATMQIFDWTTGSLLRRVQVISHILPNRCIRAETRKLKRSRNFKGVASTEPGPEPSNDPASENWYLAPEGQQLPAGQGVVIEKISSVVVDGKTVIVFFAEGCTAVHSFNLDDETPEIKTIRLPLPILGFTQRPGFPTQLIVTLDTTHGLSKDDKDVSPSSAFTLISVAADAQLSEVSDELVATLNTTVATTQAPVATLASLRLYLNLALYPRWPGFEEDEELAGPAAESAAPSTATSAAPSDEEKLTSRHLGRLKAGGADVQHLLGPRKKRKGKNHGKKEVSAEAAAAQTV